MKKVGLLLAAGLVTPVLLFVAFMVHVLFFDEEDRLREFVCLGN